VNLLSRFAYTKLLSYIILSLIYCMYMSDLTPIEYNGQLVVDSRLIAEELGVQHSNFMQLIYNYQTEAEQEFGIYLFETDKLKGRGRPQKYVLLTEDQSNFLLTLVDNTSQSVKLKAKLVRAFSQAKELLKAKFSASYWYKRLGLAMSDMDKPLQARYFCIYLEMMRFFNELEVRLGYVVPDVNLVTDEYVIPDVSIGKLFNSWLRDEDKTVSIELARKVRKEFLGSEEIVDFRDAANLKAGYRPAGKNNYELVKYNHVFPKESHPTKNIHPVNSYPNRYKSIFHYYLEEHYIPERCFSYIEKRDPDGIEQIKLTLSLMPDNAKSALSKTLAGRFIQNLLPPGK
jgi:phage regulator Rha-like protein